MTRAWKEWRFSLGSIAKEGILWSIGRLAADRKNAEFGLRTGRCAARAIVDHLLGGVVEFIDAADDSHRWPTDDNVPAVDSTVTLKAGTDEYALIGVLAAAVIADVVDEATNGRKWKDLRFSDRSLIGFCDGTGVILSSRLALRNHLVAAFNNIKDSEHPSTDAIFFLTIAAKRAVSHEFGSILSLAYLLSQTPRVDGVEKCGSIIEKALAKEPINSILVFCPCHTDPMKSVWDMRSRG